MKKRITAHTNLFHDWRLKNRLGYALFANGMGLFASVVMIFFDHLFLVNPILFTSIRAVNILLIIPNLFFIHKWGTREKHTESAQNTFSFMILWPIFIFNLSYFIFCFYGEGEKFFVYYTGLLATSFFCTFMLHRFPREQYIYNFGISFLALGLMGFLRSDQFDNLYIVVIIHLCASFMSMYFRRQFVKSLTFQFDLLRTMVPEKIAQYIVSGGERLRNNVRFQPRNRFSVCLCADWRSFQKLSGTKDPEQITEMLEKYYDIILRNLESLLPDKNYYFNWNADELFVVFFNDHDDERLAISEGLKFAFQMCNEIYAEVDREFRGEIHYDVGLSAGIGYLGLVGPREMKKTTINGQVAGRAKRLEQEAKLIRKQEGGESPRLVMEERLFDHVMRLQLGGEGHFDLRSAQTPDIKDQKIYVWILASKFQIKKAG
ncbi:MAG: adenylate/guanylate cyclase domain-containing protein [Pseudobdellovibrionaceae bacterium]